MNIEQYIGVEQVKALSNQTPTILAATSFTSLATTFVMWLHFPPHLPLIWLTTSLTLVVIRWFIYKSNNRTPVDIDNYQKRLNAVTFASVLFSLNAGLAVFLFHDTTTPTFSILLVCLFTAYVSASAASIGLYFPAFLAGSIPVTILFVVRYIVEPDLLYKIMTAVTITYFFVLLGIARIINKSFKAAKTLEFDNERLLEQVTIQKNLAEKAIVEKNHFLAAASHDLRQPLHAMGLYIDALKPRLADSFDQNILKKITQSNGALNELLHSLLDISKLDADVVKNRPQHFYLNRITHQLSAEFKSEAAQRGLILQFNVDAEQVVYGDPVLLERVLRNLLSNALKYTETGFVKVTSQLQNDAVQIKVVDTGVGVKNQDIDRIFSEYIQLDNPERDRRKGLGLGLAIVKRLCSLQEIPYEFESEFGQGTTVTLAVKLGEGALCALETNGNAPTLRRLTILFVDDDEAIRDSMKMIIQSWQCLPIIASTMAEAIALVQTLDQDLDVIVSDLRLQNNETGTEVVDKIRQELNVDIPAIIVTGDTAIDRLQLASSENVTLMHKPIAALELRQQIVKLVDGSNKP